MFKERRLLLHSALIPRLMLRVFLKNSSFRSAIDYLLISMNLEPERAILAILNTFY